MILVHLSNVFLDGIFPSLSNPLLGKYRRERLRSILEEIVEASVRRKVDAILIAGNLLYDSWITEDTTKWLFDLFGSLRPIKVFVAPGESDCLCEESVYLYQTFPDNVFIFTQPEWEVISDDDSQLCVVGYGKYREGMYLEEPPKVELSKDMNNVCLAYDVGFNAEEVFSKSDVRFSYIALGNTLVEKCEELQNKVVVSNSGATERFDFSQGGIPGFYCVHFIFDGSSWRVSNIERLPVKCTTYEEIVLDCSNYEDSQNLLQEAILMIREKLAPRIVRLKLVGNVSLPVFNEFLINIGELGRECDSLTVSAEVNFLEVSEKSEVKLPFIINEFYNTVNWDIKSAPSDKLREIIKRATYLVLSIQEGKEPVFPLGVGV